MGSTMKIVAHRGASALAPENTMAAFLKALELGVDVIETDVRLTRDHQFVLSHDDNLLRLAGQPRMIDEIDLGELQAIAIGTDSLHGDQTTPRLVDLFRVIRGQIRVLLDLKLGAGYEEDLVNLIQTAGVEQDVILGVRSIGSLRTLKSLASGLTTLSFGYPLDAVWNMTDEGVDIIRLWSMWVDAPVMDRAKRIEKPVWVMCGVPNENRAGNATVQELLLYRRLGADGVILNDPRLALEANSREME
jgi:glycerophosphoryl diester phosphodiesterase